MSLHGYSLHCVQISMPFCLAHWRILQSGGPPPVLHVQFKLISFWRNCQNVGNVFFISGMYWYQLSMPSSCRLFCSCFAFCGMRLRWAHNPQYRPQ